MQAEAQKLSIKEKVGYAVGDTASNLYFQIFMLLFLWAFMPSWQFFFCKKNHDENYYFRAFEL